MPKGALPFWERRLGDHGVAGLSREIRFGDTRLAFEGPDGDGFALVEVADDRSPWLPGDVPADMAIRGFHSVDMRLSPRGAAANAELLRFMGYDQDGSDGNTARFRVGDGNAAQVIDISETGAEATGQGAGCVHHVAFSVEDRAAQLEVRQALIDRDYFWAIYFRSPGGVLFEVATKEPGFDRDEDVAHLGETLKLPRQHAHLRAHLEQILEPVPA